MQNQVFISPFFIDQPAQHLVTLSQEAWDINQPDLPQGDAQDKASAVHQPLADKVASSLRRGQRPISIAGDCCASIPVLAGLQRANIQPTLLWLDAHGDFNTWETSPSGFLGGMPLAMMAGLGDQRMPTAVNLEPIPAERIVLADGRDLDPGERRLITDSGLLHLPSFEQLKTYPVEGPVYIHFDCDVVHLDDIPAVRYPATGGPKASEVADVFKHLKKNLEIVAVSSTLGAWKRGSGRNKSDKTALELLELLL